MLLPTDYVFHHCILCCTNPPSTKEHIFPESIGGRFQAFLLCPTCNNNRGGQLAATIQKASWYLEALKTLRDDLPDLYKATSFYYSSRLPDGTVIKSSIKNGVHKITTAKMGGVIIADEKDIPDIVRDILSKAQHPGSDIAHWVKTAENLTANGTLQLPNGAVIRKQVVTHLVPSNDPNCTCELAAALIAYEFLALLIGKPIFSSDFDSLREMIISGKPSETIHIKALHALIPPRPRHEIYFTPGTGELLVTVKFFTLEVYEIKFENFSRIIPDMVFLEDIKGKKSFLALTKEAARQGKFHDLSLAGSTT